MREVRKDYARFRTGERADGGDFAPVDATAEREARRTVAGTGHAVGINHFDGEQRAQIQELAATYVADGAALEVMRLTELASVYHAYEDELARRGALDFGEQIAAVIRLFKRRPNILRRWQRQYRYLLVDEFQDANIAQIELIELLGRTPDRPDNVMVVGDDDQSIYRFRGASYAAFAEFDRRFSQPPAHDPNGAPPGPPPRLRIEENFRSPGNVLAAANRLICGNAIRFEPDKRLRTEREDGLEVQVVVCGGEEDEAVAIVDAIRERVGATQGWGDAAVLYRKHKHRDAIVKRLQDEDIPYTVVGGLSLFAMPEIRDLEQSLRAIANPNDGPALTRMMTAGPWRLDALEILHVTRIAHFDKREPLLDVIRRLVETGETPTATTTEAARRGRRHRHHRARHAGEAAAPAGRHRRAPRQDLARGPAHHPGALPGADRPGPGPGGGEHGRGASGGGQHRLTAAVRGGLAGRPSGRQPGRLRRLPRRVPGGRRRAADQRGAVARTWPACAS